MAIDSLCYCSSPLTSRARPAGGIAASEGSNVTILDSIFVNNSAGTSGAISQTGGSLAIYNTTFVSNIGSNVRACSLKHTISGLLTQEYNLGEAQPMHLRLLFSAAWASHAMAL